jgi:hypothetical protein
VGLKVPQDLFEEVLEHFLKEQEKDGPKVRRHEEHGGDGVYGATRSVAPGWDRARGWGYTKGQPITGSMTTAGVACVAIAASELRSAKLRARAERSVRDGIAWLGVNFAVDRNPGAGAGMRGGRMRGGGLMWHYYYLYGLERAGVLAGVVYMGEHRWYAEGARYLVDQQLDEGSWRVGFGRDLGPRFRGIRGRGTGTLEETCFALLFLLRSTGKSYGTATPQALLDLTRGGDLSDRDLADLLRAAFAEMERVPEGERDARAREFAFLGPRAIGLLLPLLHAEAEPSRVRAIRILRAITGKSFGYVPEAPVASRERAVDAWTGWYLTNRSELRLDREARLIR